MVTNILLFIISIRVSVTRLPPSNSDESHIATDNDHEENTEEERNDQDLQAADDERIGEGEAPRM